MKEPPPTHQHQPASKIKIVCSFNGHLAPTPPNNILRYIGGETRIVTIHRHISFSELHSKISLLCPNVSPFCLKYQLPTLSNRKKIESLVSLVSDDDVKCMIEEFDVAEELGMCSRLWVFVFSEESFDVVNVHGDGIGFRNNGFYRNEKSLFVNGVREWDGCDSGFEFKSLSRQRNPRDEHGNGCGKIGVVDGVRADGNGERARRGVKNGELVRKPMAVSGVEGNEIGKKTKFDGDSRYYCHPLIDLASQACGLLGGDGINGTVSNGTRQSGCHIQDPRLCPLSLNDGILRVQPNSSLHSNLEQYDVISGQMNCLVHDQKQLPHYENSLLSNNFEGKPIELALDGHVNEENIMPQASDINLVCRDLPVSASLVDSSPLSGRLSLVGSHYSICYHRWSINDAKYQRGYSHGMRSNHNSLAEVENHRAVGFDGRLSGLRSSPGLKPNANISKQGQVVRLNHPEYMKPWFKLYNHSLKGSLRNINSGAHNQSKLGNVATAPCVDAYTDVGDQTALYFKAISQTNDTVGNVKEDLLAGGKDNNAPSCAPVWSGSREKVNGLNPQENVDTTLQKLTPSVDLSIHNLSLTSFEEVEPSIVSSASSDVSDGLTKPHAKSINLMEFSSRPKDDEHNEACSLATSRDEDNHACEEETPQEHLTCVRIGKNEDIGKCQNSSKVIGGVSSFPVSFYTHLATQELQTIKSSELEYVKELGSGTYGTVYHGKWNGSDVAVKKLKASCFTDGEVKGDRLVNDFWREAHILGQLHHPNIVAFYGVVTDGPLTSLATVTEYMVNGSLKQVLWRKDRTIDRRKRLIIAMDASFGMEYLHGKNIVHFDLKSHNFLVNMRDPQRPVCKIGDLGLSKIKKRTLVSGGLRGTVPWMAPELFSSKNNMVTEKVDVYSFGIVMWELLTGEEPYGKMHSEDIIAGIVKGTLRPEIPPWCDPAWRSLMERCWSTDPNLRPSFSETAKELRAMAAAMNIK